MLSRRTYGGYVFSVLAAHLRQVGFDDLHFGAKHLVGRPQFVDLFLPLVDHGSVPTAQAIVQSFDGVGVELALREEAKVAAAWTTDAVFSLV